MSNKTIEVRIADALKDDITAAEIGNLLVEVENALAEAEQNAVAVRKAAMDPIAFSDAVKARAAVEMATFAVDRLRAAQSRLTQRYNEVDQREHLARWTADRDRVKARRDVAAARFAKCRELIEQLAGIFTEVEEVDRDVSRINSASPSGQPHVQGAELIARNLASFSSSDRSIVASTTLLGWDGKAAWPRKPTSVAMAMAPIAYDSRRNSADWHGARSGDAVKKDGDRVSDWYRRETQEQEARQLREAEEALAARQRSA